MLMIKVSSGPGCAIAKKLEQITRSAVTMFGLDAQVERSPATIPPYHEVSDPLPPPALVINEKVRLLRAASPGRRR